MRNIDNDLIIANLLNIEVRKHTIGDKKLLCVITEPIKESVPTFEIDLKKLFLCLDKLKQTQEITIVISELMYYCFDENITVTSNNLENCLYEFIIKHYMYGN